MKGVWGWNMRAFMALELPDMFRWEVAGLARQLREVVKGRFAPPENYHVTLAFLGDADDAAIRAATDVLCELDDNVGEVLLESTGLGKFGKARDATLWLGIRESDALLSVAENVRLGLAARGVSYDAKPFKSHITLARRTCIPSEEFPPLTFPAPALATALVLFKSQLGADGATYSPLHRIELPRRPAQLGPE